MPQKCYNDGNFYYVQQITDAVSEYLKIKAEAITEFVLPDGDTDDRYYDPGEFANVVTMPCNKKYYTWSATKIQKIYAGVMALIIMGLIIGLIATV